MTLGQGLNRAAYDVFAAAEANAKPLRLSAQQLACGARVLDFGIEALGGLAAGIQLAEICMAAQAKVQLASGDRQVWPGPWVHVASDHPLQACMLSQYAGWPVQVGDFFAMGSGPMRLLRGREKMLEQLQAADDPQLAVGTLECDVLPDCKVAEAIAQECGISADRLGLAVAPTRSVAGCVQVVARSVETSLHKLHELGFALDGLHSAWGSAPLPPPTPKLAAGIGRTNDAILYGAQVSLWVDADDEQIVELGPQLPSCASSDYGAPFAEVFKRYNHDFYKVDPGLFSPAQVLILNLRSGRSWTFGEIRPDLLASSFATE